jgi:hypothetical protein
MSKRTVVVEGGGANLYCIYQSGDRFTAYKVNVRLLSSDEVRIGSSRSLEDAISLVQAHSGRRIKSIY